MTELTNLEKFRMLRANQREPKAKCLKCGELSELEEFYAGSYVDEAYGAPKLHKVYRLLTTCCKSEDYITEDEMEEGKDNES